jgi:hypothetical protein
MFFPLCFSFFVVANAFEIRNSLRSILSIHAFASSALTQLQEELILHQYNTLVSNHLSFTIDGSLHWMRENSGLFVTGFVFWFGYQTYYSPTAKLFKLQDFLEYTQLKKYFRTVFLIFVFIFIRDVQNAI